MKRTSAIALCFGLVAASPLACGTDGDTSSSSTSTGTGSSTGAAMQTCSECLQEAALSTACKDKTTTCLGDTGQGGAGGAMACSSCKDWALVCQTKSLDECEAAQATLCADSLVLATDLQNCTCAPCKSLCGAQCM